MKPTTKKLVGGLLVGILIAAIGVPFATGQTNGTNHATTPLVPFEGRHGMSELGPFVSNLTDAQQTELWDLITTLRDQNATPEEISTAIQEKLDEFGVLDMRLDFEINQTEQRLTLLTRQKELRNEGYSWEEIRTIIQDEFDVQNTTGLSQDMMLNNSFERGPSGGSHGFIPPEESDQ
jgi:DNA-binding transcriptional MerR regulator